MKKPNKDDITEHLTRLYRPWDGTEYLYEIRCLDPEGRRGSPTMRFGCTHDGLICGMRYAEQNNLAAYNIYVCVNILKADVRSTHATDADVAMSCYHFIDADGKDGQGDVASVMAKINALKIQPAIIVQTGSIPRQRIHAAWKMNIPIDMTNPDSCSAWIDMQKRLSQHFETDITIHNPSRIMRLAGTVSYATPKKVKDYGYQSELTKLLKEPK